MGQQSSATGELPRGILPFPGVRLPGTAEPAAYPNPKDVDEEERRWEELRARLVDRWPVLTADELDATHGEPALVEALLEAKLGYGRRLVEETFRPWLLRTTRPRRRMAYGLLGVLGLIGAGGLAFFGLLVR